VIEIDLRGMAEKYCTHTRLGTAHTCSKGATKVAEQVVAIDMDQKVDLTVSVSARKPYDYKSAETLSHETTAPLYIIKGVRLGSMAEVLCERVLQRFTAKLHEEVLAEMRAEENEDGEDKEETS